MLRSTARHWPEYLMEGALLGAFMVSACVFTTLLEHPASPVHQAMPDPVARRILMGLAMGSTAIGLIYSPWGRQSGAHFNPSVTLAFLRLGKVAPADALFYAGAQFAGGIAGVMVARAALGGLLDDAAVNYAATVPGPLGIGAAFAAEALISFWLMLVVLAVSNTARLSRFTGIFAGAMVAAWIAIESPLSGMSMNPARSLGSALPAMTWRALWIYFTAPPLGMLLAAEAYRRLHGAGAVLCAKLHHHTDRRCIFRCRWTACSPS